MNLDAILNSDTRSISRASGFMTTTASYPKMPVRADSRPKSGYHNVLPQRSEKLHHTHVTNWRATTATGEPVVSNHAMSRNHGIIHPRANSVHVDPAALQSLSLGSNNPVSPASQQSSIQVNDQRSKYHRSVYGTSGLYSQARGTASGNGASVGRTLHQTPTSRTATPSKVVSQSYWAGARGGIATHPLPSSRPHHSTAPTTPSIEDIPDETVSVISDEGVRSDTEDESRLTPDTPDSEHHHEHTMAASGRCVASANCELLSPDRKVTSHYFGRNKKETRAIPEHCWVLYCRQHYQRRRYRHTDAEFAEIQMKLVKATVVNLEKWGGVKDWSIALRKRVLERLNEEDRMSKANLDAKNRGLAPPHTTPSKETACKERWLVRFCGKNQSFDNVYQLIDAVLQFCLHVGCPALEFEIVPNIPTEPSKKQTTVKRAATSKPGASNRVQKPARNSAKAISPRTIARAKN